MFSIYSVSQPRQEEASRSFLILGVGSREEALCALSFAQHATSVVIGLTLVASSPNVTHLSRSNSTETEKSDEAPAEPAYAHDKPISAAELSARTYNALLKGRVKTVGQLCAMELRDLMLLRNFGKKAVKEAVAYRTRLGIQ